MRWAGSKILTGSVNQGTVSRQMLHSRCYCTWELKVLLQFNCHVQVTHRLCFFELLDLYWIHNDFNINHITGYDNITNENSWSSTPYICFCRSCEESMIVIQVKHLRWKTWKRKTPRKEQGLRIAITMEASTWMADCQRLSKSGGTDLISDCPERNLIGMQPAPICLKFHRGAFAWNSIGCTWNPWEREATKRRGGGMRDCLGSQMATIWSTSISRFGFIRSKSWCRIQNWFYTSVINSQIHSTFCRPHQNLKSSCLICSLSFKLKLQ